MSFFIYMSASYSYNNVSFGKSLVATCCIPRNNNERIKCNVYKLDADADALYFENLEKKKNWYYNALLHEADYELKDKYNQPDIYVIESRKRQCLGYVIVDFVSDSKEHQNNKAFLDYIETLPIYSKRNSDRNVKYIGETLVAFIVEMAKKNNSKLVSIPFFADSARDFYIKNCGFELAPILNDGLVMYSDKYDSLVQKNRAHIGQKIEFVG